MLNTSVTLSSGSADSKGMEAGSVVRLEVPALAPTFRFSFGEGSWGDVSSTFSFAFPRFQTHFLNVFCTRALFLASGRFFGHPCQCGYVRHLSSVIVKICHLCHLSSVIDDR